MQSEDGPHERLNGWRIRVGRARQEWQSFLTTRTGIGLVVAFVVVAVVADALPNPRPEPSAGPSSRPGPSATSGATEPPAEAWDDLSVPNWEPVAELRPVDVDASGVFVHSAFTLRSRTSVPAAVLAVGLSSEPPLTFHVLPGATAAEVTLSPAEDLDEGVLYRFRLADPSGALTGSWAFRTQRPLRVVSTLPGHQTTSVPVNTGIEIEFDQDGVTDISAQFSIEPAVAGRFEVHDRTVVFVPRAPLTAASSYRVTIAAGVKMTGSDQVLEAPVSFAFETAAKNDTIPDWDVVLGRPIIEVSPDEPPIVGLDIVQREGASPLTAIPFEVYRLPSLTAAREAAATLSLDEGWGQWADNDLIATSGLPRVAAFDGAFESSGLDGYKVVRFPAALAAGWYVLVVPRDGRDRQALLQVTTLAAFALTSETRTLAWVNDTATGAPVAGAVLADPAGASVGTTAANGLLDVATPVSLLGEDDASRSSGMTTVVTVSAPDGRRLLLALGLQQRTNVYAYEFSSASYRSSPDHRWWLLQATDRTTYRSTDTIHTWGLIRSRTDASVPDGLQMTLRTGEGSSSNGPWLARVPVTTTARGTWAADLPIDDLPPGGYIVELRAGDIVASSTWIVVAELRKPAYRIDVTTDAHAYIAGEAVTISGHAVFFDGTPVAGIDLRVEAFGQSKAVTADALGQVRVVIPAMTGGAYIDQASIRILPASPEEAEIVGYTTAFVFPSADWIRASGTITGARLAISGTLNRVDLDRVERQVALGEWPEDPSGAAIAGGTVTVRVVENIAIARQVGTTYDFIEKRAIPLFDYTYQQKVVGTYTMTSTDAGEFTLSVPVPNAEHEYTVTLTARDAKGRTASTDLYVVPDTDVLLDQPFGRAYLEGPPGCGDYSEPHAVGDTFALTMHDGDGTVSTGGRYLFVVARHGIREAIVGNAGTVTRTYAEADLPSLSVIAVQFRNGVYVVTNEVRVTTKLESRTLNVELSADRLRYGPGERATIAVRTTDQNGQPITADVVIRAVDEKLFEIGAALDVDALAALVAPLGDGLLQSYASHQVPVPGGGGDCGGGGGREDFRDSALFKLISTDTDGRGIVAFDLPDDLTSWHVSATAVASDVRAGSGSLLVPVGLPFFADAILASDYLVGERPILRVRSFGDDLAAGDRVRFTISAPSLLLPTTTVEAAAFETATLQLPELPVGVHDLTISASVVGDAGRTDTLIRKVVVRWSRLEVATSAVTTLAAAGSVGGAGLTTYVVTDAGRGSLVPLLQNLAYGSGGRFDRRLAADLARDLLVETFRFADSSLPPVDLDVANYQRGGVALLPYSSPELALTSMTAIVTPERLNTESARVALREWMVAGATNRERQIIALAGLAGIGDDVLADLRAIDIDAVTVREALWVALGLVASGDENGARVIERALLEAHGQAFGPWVRLDVGGSLTETLDAASLLALVATGVGDPLAPRVARYVNEVHTTESLYVLPEIGVIRWSLDRLPRTAASFAWTVDGQRHTETLEPGASWSVALTERQRTAFLLEPLTGAVSVIATWSRIAGASDLPAGDLVTITRTVTPAADAPTTGLVRVQLLVEFAATAPRGCWDVSDRTPSGLAPVVNIPDWDAAAGGGVLWPYEISGQRVSWCVDPANRRTLVLGYSARVVSGGTFTWEPAIVQSEVALDVGATTPAVEYTIR